MNALFVYMVKVAVYITCLYFVYSILLSRDTSYGRNRAFILSSLILSFIFPSITIQTIRPLDIQYFGKLLSDVFITSTGNGSESLHHGFSGYNPLKLVYLIYVAGVAALLIKLFFELFNILILITRQKNQRSPIIRFHGFNTAGFSAMGYIFINTRLNSKESREIIKHELNHLKRYHFADILFIETVKAIQWFNPFIYMFDRSLRAIHEYQADRGCLNSGMTMLNYQYLLLSQVFKTKTFNLTNSFSNPSLIKKRMIMMTKNATSPLADLKILIAIPVLSIVFLAISAYKEIPDNSSEITSPVNVQENSSPTTTLPSLSKSLTPASSPEIKSEIKSEKIVPPPPPPPPQQSQEIKKDAAVNVIAEKEEDISLDPFVVVEEMPQFPGGEGNLLKFIAQNVNYPASAKENNIQGRVIIRFCVEADGNVKRITVLKGVDPDLDAEAIRVVKNLPAFEPGRQGGKAVPVWYMVPITFNLK